MKNNKIKERIIEIINDNRSGLEANIISEKIELDYYTT